MPTITLDIPDTTFVSSALPEYNFSSYPVLFTGNDPSYAECTGLMKINLPSLPVKYFADSAILQLFVIVKTGAVPSTVKIGRALSPFDAKTVMYYTLPPSTLTPSQTSITEAELFTSVQIDVTELVNNWLDEIYPNNGIVLKTPESATIVEFATNAITYEPYFPKLALTYSEVPEKPAEAPVETLAEAPVEAPAEPVEAPPVKLVNIVNPLYTLPVNPVAMEITPDSPAEANEKTGLLSKIARLYDGFRMKISKRK